MWLVATCLRDSCKDLISCPTILLSLSIDNRQYVLLLLLWCTFCHHHKWKEWLSSTRPKGNYLVHKRALLVVLPFLYHNIYLYLWYQLYLKKTVNETLIRRYPSLRRGPNQILCKVHPKFDWQGLEKQTTFINFSIVVDIRLL